MNRDHSYIIPRDLPWSGLAVPLERAGLALCRLDERIRRDPVGAGFVERQHFMEACATQWTAGELVHLEDLVLADADASHRISTIELNRARAVLLARRKAAAKPPAWPLSDDALLGDRSGAGRAEVVYEPGWDEDERLDEWRAILKQTESLPAMLAAAIVWDAWRMIEPVQRGAWRAGLVAAAILRLRGVAQNHLPAICIGARPSKFRYASHADFAGRLAGFLDWATHAAIAGEKELDRLTLARAVLRGRLKDKGRHEDSRLPALIDLFLSRPLVSATMAAHTLKITPEGFEVLRKQLGSTLREMTGRSRYRAWGIL